MSKQEESVTRRGGGTAWERLSQRVLGTVLGHTSPNHSSISEFPNIRYSALRLQGLVELGAWVGYPEGL